MGPNALGDQLSRTLRARTVLRIEKGCRILARSCAVLLVLAVLLGVWRFARGWGWSLSAESSADLLLDGVSRVALAAAGTSPRDIEYAMTHPPEDVLPPNAVHVSFRELPAVLDEARKSGHPHIFFVYSSVLEPTFENDGSGRVFRSNVFGAAALAIRKAYEKTDPRARPRLYACRLSVFSPTPPERLRALESGLGLRQGIFSGCGARAAIALVSADGHCQGRSLGCMCVWNVPATVEEACQIIQICAHPIRP